MRLDNCEQLLMEFGLLSDREDEEEEDAPPVAVAVANKAPRFHQPLDVLRARISRVTSQQEELHEQRGELAEQREELEELRESFAGRQRAVASLVAHHTALNGCDYAAEYEDFLQKNAYLEKKMELIHQWESVLDQCAAVATQSRQLLHRHSRLDNVMDLVEETGHYQEMPRREACALLRRLDCAGLLQEVALGRATVKTLQDAQYYIFLALEQPTLALQAYIVIRKDLLFVT